MSVVNFNKLIWPTFLSFVSLSWLLCEYANKVREFLLLLINRLEGRGVFLNTGFVFSGDSSCDGVLVSLLSISFKFDVCAWSEGGGKLHAPESDAPLQGPF